MHKLKAQLHMSEKQAQGAVVEVANTLFGRKWKLYEQKQDADNDTLPAPSNINRTELSAEAMVLSSVVDEIVSQDSEDTVITYANGGSSKSRVVSFVVQSFMVNGKQRVLPVMSIFTESKESLKDLELTTLRILSAAIAGKHT